MNRNIIQILFWFICCVLCIVSCRKQPFDQLRFEAHNEMRSWLQQHGKGFAKEVLWAETMNGKKEKAQLVWLRDSTYTEGEFTYTEIPFLFEGGISYIYNDKMNAWVSYKLVFKRQQKIVDAALQVTTRDRRLLNQTTQKMEQVRQQEYFALDGRPLLLWLAISGKNGEQHVWGGFFDKGKQQRNLSLNIGHGAQKRMDKTKNTHSTRMVSVPRGGLVVDVEGYNCEDIEIRISYPGYTASDGTIVVYADKVIRTQICYYMPPASGDMGGGGAYFPPTIDNQYDYKKEDLCDVVKRKSEEWAALLEAHPEIKEYMRILQESSTARIEKGFAVYRSPTGEIKITSMAHGSSSNVNIPRLEGDLIFSAHSHPHNHSSVHSATDIMRYQQYQTNPHYIGDVIVHGNDIYMMYVENWRQYNKFYDKYIGDIDPKTNDWKDESDLYEFRDGYKDRSLYPKNASIPIDQMIDQYSNLFTLSQHSSGLRYMQYSPQTSSFTPLKVIKHDVNGDNTGSTVVLGNDGNTAPTYQLILTNPCSKKK